jgi:hypothetical protein
MLLTILGILPSDHHMGGIFLAVQAPDKKLPIISAFNIFQHSLLFHFEQLAVKKLGKIWNISVFAAN